MISHLKVDEADKVQAFLLPFILIGAQVGFGVTSFQRIIFDSSKRDAWISVLFSAIAIHFIVFIILKLLSSYKNQDVYGINHLLFGKMVGSFFNILFIGYFLFSFFISLINYILIVKVWVFPNVPVWLFALLLLLLVVYGIMGGIRIVIGMTFLSILVVGIIFIGLYQPFKYMDFRNFFPMFKAAPFEWFQGTFRMMVTVSGFELLLILYPYLSNKKVVGRYSQIGVFFTSLFFLIMMMMSIGYFSSGQLERTIWPTLTMFKINQFPFLERFEIIIVSFWMIVMIPKLLLYYWSAAEGLKRNFKISLKKTLIIFMPVFFILSIFVQTEDTVMLVTDSLRYMAFSFSVIFPVFLYLVTLVKRRFQQHE
ncbi:GerAB/ArcD/ProY family transporter [Bacillus carboniphilus]|uniref:GerAB/ArcD/ProY family transporter n=1 Tax=Bacillus carboniphilus TaxID=86663 RepID=A0ABY9JUG3_9BACI|nr:GerAB/ArcD/ProY family transporter [Bacillus carboniphilus]WLR43017.1 GerAB/ArcD/ProY family transporter [Bacillus carboniphilus]